MSSPEETIIEAGGMVLKDRGNLGDIIPFYNLPLILFYLFVLVLTLVAVIEVSDLIQLKTGGKTNGCG